MVTQTRAWGGFGWWAWATGTVSRLVVSARAVATKGVLIALLRGVKQSATNGLRKRCETGSVNALPPGFRVLSVKQSDVTNA
ncbi:hypothetical protein GCM10009534_06470 [Kribbella sandramycini]